MKSFFICILGAALTFNINAQLLPSASSTNSKSSIVKNGTITYKMSIDSKDPQAAMLNGSTFEFAFNGSDSKLAALIMGGLFSGNLIFNGSNNDGLALMNLMGQKKAIKMNADDINSAQESTTGLDKVKISPISGTKQIAGYTCKKMLMSSTQDPNVKTVVYVCDKIKPDSGTFFNAYMQMFKGFPLGFEVNSGTDKISILASEVSSKIPKKSEFKLNIPSDYQETTIEKIMEDFGGTIRQ